MTRPALPAPPLGERAAGDRLYRLALGACAACVPLLLAMVAGALLAGAWPALAGGGLRVLAGAGWDPVREHFAVGPALLGTLLTSVVALAVAAPLAVVSALWVAELAPPRLRAPLAATGDLLAAVPGVVYGLFGVLVLVPALRASVLPALQGITGSATPTYGPSLLAAALVLAIMVLPFITAVSREVLRAVPASQREAALALGATPWETATQVVLPYARAGVAGAVMLGLGRALGETIAVAMVVGGAHGWAPSLLAPGYTLGALVANEFGEASGASHLAALMAAALALFLVTLVVNAIARWLVGRVAAEDAA